jgi:hypothetical protein
MAQLFQNKILKRNDENFAKAKSLKKKGQTSELSCYHGTTLQLLITKKMVNKGEFVTDMSITYNTITLHSSSFDQQQQTKPKITNKI